MERVEHFDTVSRSILSKKLNSLAIPLTFSDTSER